jgi:3-hydroxyisobutyrate dehydrogenase-like beta-hydroxyacid dehydrogenase
MPREAVGVVGLGNMGGVLAARLARAGPVTAFDLDPARCSAASDGVEIAESAAAVEGIALDDLCALLEQDDAGVKRPLTGRLAGRARKDYAAIATAREGEAR